MCLAVRGRILTITSEAPGDGATPPDPADPLWRMAEVDFGGVRHRVSLACLPDASVGDRVLVHVGLAIALVEDEEGEGEGEGEAQLNPDRGPWLIGTRES